MHDSRIQMILKEMEIASYDDYQEKMKKWESYEYRVFHGGQNKIDSLRDIVVEYYTNYQYQPLSGQYISIDPYNCPDQSIANYMCLFPKRSLIETSALMTYIDLSSRESTGYDLPPNDFFFFFFRFQNLVDHGISFLYPIKTDEELNTYHEKVVNSASLIPLRNIADVSQGDDFKKVVSDPEMFYLAFPWLYHARSDDFIEIAEKYPAEFTCLANAVEKIAHTSKEDLNKDVFYDLKEALGTIQVQYEIKRADLKKKGIPATVGLVLTCIPYVFPDAFASFDLSSYQNIIGGVSIFESFKLLNESISYAHEAHQNPYWVIWKWKNSVPYIVEKD